MRFSQVNPHELKRPQPGETPALRMIAWEITRSCNLSCVHCRAAAQYGPYPHEFSTQECKALIDEIVTFSNPVIILTGGEPLMREDIFEVAQYGTDKGLRMVMATNGTLITPEIARKMVASGIQRISVSIDGKDAVHHDRFRGVEGAFEGSMQGIRYAKEVGMEFQINTTITRLNLDQLDDILQLALKIGAAAIHIFLLVPTGRGKELVEQEISPEDYEKTLNWFYDQHETYPIEFKATCAPHYHRIIRQRAKAEGKPVTFQTFGLDAVTKGCLGGNAFCFISHLGQVQPCGYLELDCGNVREMPFSEIWRSSEVFLSLRDENNYKGKCGICEYRRVCGGCRARAYEMTGDYLAEEPYCTYEPKQLSQGSLVDG